MLVLLLVLVYVSVVIGISVLIFVFRLVVSRYIRITRTSRSIVVIIGVSIIRGRVIVIRVGIV
jgi:hypothetical protein